MEAFLDTRQSDFEDLMKDVRIESNPKKGVEDLVLPEPFRFRLERAIEILRGFGCSEIHLFGSVVHGELREASDIDLAVRGCPKSQFFRALGVLLTELDCAVDLVDLDCRDPFARYLEEERELLQVA